MCLIDVAQQCSIVLVKLIIKNVRNVRLANEISNNNKIIALNNNEYV